VQRASRFSQQCQDLIKKEVEDKFKESGIAMSEDNQRELIGLVSSKMVIEDFTSS